MKCTDSVWSPSSVHRCPCQMAPASPCGLTQTPQKLARTPSDSVAFRIGMVRNTWGRVKTSFSPYQVLSTNRLSSEGGHGM